MLARYQALQGPFPCHKAAAITSSVEVQLMLLISFAIPSLTLWPSREDKSRISHNLFGLFFFGELSQKD